MRRARSPRRRIDVLVDDAGEIEVGPLETMTERDFARSIDTHFWGPLSTSFAVLPEMRARGAGRIVNIASIGGLLPVPHLAPYSASKAALVGEPFVVFGAQARLAHLAYAMFPNLLSRLLSVTSRMLPESGGISERVRGHESTSSVSPSLLTALGERAATKNREIF